MLSNRVSRGVVRGSAPTLYHRGACAHDRADVLVRPQTPSFPPFPDKGTRAARHSPSGAPMPASVGTHSRITRPAYGLEPGRTSLGRPAERGSAQDAPRVGAASSGAATRKHPAGQPTQESLTRRSPTLETSSKVASSTSSFWRLSSPQPSPQHFCSARSRKQRLRRLINNLLPPAPARPSRRKSGIGTSGNLTF